MGSKIYSAGELIGYSIGGGWGKEEPQGDFQAEVAIIRGADFPSIEQGIYDELPVRWEKKAKATKASLQPGDIVLEISGGTDDRPTGRTLYVTEELLDSYECPVIPASFCRLLRPVSDINSAYLFYWLQNMYAKGRTWGYQNRSTGLSNFQYKIFAELEQVTVPELEAQQQTAKLLLALEEKRHLNNRTNDYLAAMCEAVAGAMDADGTTVLEDISSQVTTKVGCEESAIESYVSTESLLPDKGGRQTAAALPATGKVTVYQPGDTLVSNIRPYFKKIWYADREGTCSGDVIVFRSKEPELAPYLYSVLRSDGYFEHVMAGAKGTKMPRGDKKQMMQYPVANGCSEEDLVILASMLNQISANNRENASLTELRDTLLPKLMSGEIDISRIEL